MPEETKIKLSKTHVIAALAAVLILLVAATGVGYKIGTHRTGLRQFALDDDRRPMVSPPAGPNARGGAQLMVTKGSNLKDSPIAKYAFQIAPGTMSQEAQNALVGWTVTSKTQTDGSTVVTLTPKDSTDQSQQYTIKPAQILYFIEQTPVDDKNDQDKDLNYRDDYGVITDAAGIIQ